MSDLVGNPEDRFSQNEAQVRAANKKLLASPCNNTSLFDHCLVGNYEERFNCGSDCARFRSFLTFYFTRDEAHSFIIFSSTRDIEARFTDRA